MALGPGEMHNRIIENLPEKTGHPLSHWLKVLDGMEESRKVRMASLKSEHGLGHQTAVAVIREKTNDVPWTQPENLEAALRAKIAPAFIDLYDDFCAHAQITDGVTVVPCKTYTGFKNKRQFAVIQPSKTDGLIVGFALPPSAHPELTDAKSVGSARITAQATADAGLETLQALFKLAVERD